MKENGVEEDEERKSEARDVAVLSNAPGTGRMNGSWL